LAGVPSSQRERESRKVTSYLPDNSLRNGYLSLLRDIVVEIVSTRWLTYQLFRRDLFSFYKQSLLGAFWVVFVPLVTVGTFIVLKGSGVVATGKVQAPYPVYAAIGIGIWQLFSQGLVAGANSLVAGGEMITRINFSKKSLVIASMGRTLVSFAVVVVLFLVLLGYYAGQGWTLALRPALLLVPFALIPMLLITLGLSFYLALINGVVRDVGTMLSMLLTFLMLLTPVLYERPVIGPDAGQMARLLDAITEYNPLYYLVAGPRELLLNGVVSEPSEFLISSAVAIVLFLVSVVGFHLTETRIAERI
jgi:ABC-type polysaccharide/polyol phosphate export permease